MTPAQRLARLPGCWRPGMRDVGDHNVPYSRIVDVWPNGYPRRWTNEGEDGDRYTASLEEAEGLWRGCVPDLTDPATAGCIEEWARELYADPHLHAVPVMGLVGDGEPAIRWRLARFGGDSLIVDGPDGRRRPEEPTRVEVWVAAILAKLEST